MCIPNVTVEWLALLLRNSELPGLKHGLSISALTLQLGYLNIPLQRALKYRQFGYSFKGMFLRKRKQNLRRYIPVVLGTIRSHSKFSQTQQLFITPLIQQHVAAWQAINSLTKNLSVCTQLYGNWDLKKWGAPPEFLAGRVGGGLTLKLYIIYVWS
jgi:hypothetical protein